MTERKLGEKVIRLVRGDITDIEVEAFVHDITEDVKLGSGYGGAIAARGGKAVQDELNAIGSCPTGAAVVTGAGSMKAGRIIHVNGPKFREPDEEGKLQATVKSALARADELGIKQLAFPPIGTGLYQVPLDLCARVMVDTIAEHLEANGTSLQEVLLVALDSREWAPLEAKVQGGA